MTSTSRSAELMSRYRDSHVPLRLRALAAGCLLAAVACSGLTEVDTPDVVQPAQLANAAGAEALTNGALSSIYGPFIGSVYNTGVFSDEFMLPTIFTTFAD